MKFTVIALSVFMVACDPKPAAKSIYQMSGTQSERVDAVSKLLTTTTPLPSRPSDAQFFEEKLGDGRLGPADFVSFCVLTVAQGDLPAWHSVLSLPIAQKDSTYAKPSEALPWWVSESDFAQLQFYNPKSLTGRSNGWIGVASDGRIFIYTFTM